VTIPILCIALFALGVNVLTEGIARAVADTDRKGSE
jgi:ABC-type dipeptide/oligopeptide/nickel transport system permease subunit